MTRFSVLVFGAAPLFSVCARELDQIGALKQNSGLVKDFFTRAAQQMPEEDYSFSPRPKCSPSGSVSLTSPTPPCGPVL
jgi:hypothetical protein